MVDTNYDPKERHERYLRTRELKGRQKGVQPPLKGPGGRPTAATPPRNPAQPPKGPSKPTTTQDTPSEAKARVTRLEGKIKSLEGALTKALTALSEKRRSAAKTKKESSDGKTTAKERQDSKEYRDKHKEELAAKRKDSPESKKTGGSSSSSKSVSDMSVDELESRVSSIRSALSSAKSQLADAKRTAGFSHSDTQVLVLRHSAPTSRKESVHMEPDFGGYATRHDVECADGRTILPGAFQDQDGQIVPLVYQHGHKDINNVLGHCRLEARADGVYAHAFFNETPAGQTAKQQVKHGDIKFLSIFANNLVERARAGLAHAKSVIKGEIREVSLVIAGANPGAFIDNINFAHSDGSFEVIETEAIITTGLEIELAHSEDLDGHVGSDDEVDLEHANLQEILDTLDPEQTEAVNYLLSQALLVGDGTVKHSDTDAPADDAPADEADAVVGEGEGDDTVDPDAELSDEEKAAKEKADAENAAAADGGDESQVAETAAADGTETEAGDEVVQHDNTQEESSMTHNVFDQAHAGLGGGRPTASLAHGDMSQESAIQAIVRDAKKNGSLKDAVLNYVEHTGIMVNGALSHGIENIDYLFPDAQLLENSPQFVSRRMEWVDVVLSGVRKSPFSRIKTITADITPDEARARGYIKGNMKNEEFFALSKRETTPQTVYKKQKLDRDDVIDITTLDVVAWLKAEMKVMLDEEIAGAILVGDGRSIGDDDKIKETNIRPIASDAELYVTTVNVNLDDASSSIEELVDAVINNRKYYKGTGQPTFFTTEATISAFLTVKDNFGRRLYANLQDVAAVLRVAAIVPVEVMERVPDLVGIMVNLADYTLGADRGGQATMFDDFDIDYNKLRYLIETRLSGALTQPKAALVFRKVAASAALVVPVAPTFDAEDSTVTVPTVSGVTYKDGAGTTLTTGAPVTLDEGEDLHVKAFADSGKYFANSAEDEWDYTGVAVS